jgi:predicted esterase
MDRRVLEGGAVRHPILFILLMTGIAAAVVDPLDPRAGDFLDVDSDSILMLAGNAYQDGDYVGAAALYLEYLSYDSRSSGDIYNLACCFGLMGQDTLAAAYLVRAVSAGFTDLAWVSMDPDFEPVRTGEVFPGVLDSLAGVAAREAGRAGSLGFVEVPALVPVLVHLPEGYDSTRSYPLVIGLHGYGDTAERFARIRERFDDPQFIWVVPESPYAFGGGDVGYSWSSGADSIGEAWSWRLSSELVRLVAEDLQGMYPVSETFLFGFSQGCGLAYYAGLSNSDIIDGMACFSGWLDTADLPPGALEQAAGQRVFICHGRLDRVIEVSSGERARDELTALGFDVTYRDFLGGHTVPGQYIPEVQAWLEGRICTAP